MGGENQGSGENTVVQGEKRQVSYGDPQARGQMERLKSMTCPHLGHRMLSRQGCSRTWVCGGLVRLFCIRVCAWCQALLESSQSGAQGCTKEAVVAHFHEASWQDVLEEALHEVLHRERA
jgi:hypothetical protein